MTLTSGTCRVNNSSSFILAFEASKLKTKFENEYIELPQDLKIAYSLGECSRTFTIESVRCASTADAELILSNFRTLQNAGVPFMIQWAIHSTPTYFKFDGTTAYMYCLCEEIGDLEKESPGDQTVYKISRITFKEGTK